MVKNWENLSRRCAEHVSQNSDFELDKCLDDDGQGSNTKTLLFFHISLKILLNFFKIVIFSRNEKKNRNLESTSLFFLDRWTTKHKHSFFARWQFWKFCNWLHLVKQQAHIEELWKVEGCAAKTNFLKSSLLLMNGLCISICIKSENLSHPRHVCLLILELHASIEALLETHHETEAHCVKSPCFVQKTNLIDIFLISKYGSKSKISQLIFQIPEMD